MTEALTARLDAPALPTGSVQLHELEGTEALGGLFDFRIDLACNNERGIDTEKLLSEGAELVFSDATGDVRRLFGRVSSVRDRLWTESPFLLYSVSFVPRAFAMTLNQMSRVFVDASIPEILQQKLDDAGFEAGRDFNLRLDGRYPKRDLTIQYEETDMQFISRLAEHVGITISFEHTEGRDVIVFSDDNSRFAEIVGGSVPFHRRGEERGVFSFEGTTRTIPEKYVLKDYNYRTPQVELVAHSSVAPSGVGKVIEYGAHYKTKDEGDRMAQVRAEELRVGRRVYEGKSDVCQLRAGARFRLDGHPKSEDELLLVEVRHRASEPAFGQGHRAERSYVNEFRAIPAATQFRPARVTRKPKIHGAISGVIEAESGGQYAELDDQRRYHVRFMLDQGDAPKGKASSLLRMAQPHAGPGYGFHFPLRDGVEVLLTFIDGDPDRPIITGAVPNPTTPSTVGSGNGKRNVIRTGGGTEINIDDNESGTRFKVTTPDKNTVLQLGAPNAPVQGAHIGTDKDIVFTAGEDATVTAGLDVTLQAGVKVDIVGGASISAAAPLIDVVAVNNLNASGTWIDVKGGAKVRVGAPQIELNGGTKISAGAPEIELTGGSKISASAPTIALKGDASIGATAPQIQLSADGAVLIGGQAAIVLGAGAVVSISGGAVVNVSAPVVNVNGSAAVNIKGGVIKLNG